MQHRRWRADSRSKLGGVKSTSVCRDSTCVTLSGDLVVTKLVKDSQAVRTFSDSPIFTRVYKLYKLII